jgi:Leucine-rich repeat (LRR) protein
MPLRRLYSQEERGVPLLTAFLQAARRGQEIVSCVSMELASVPASFFACSGIVQLNLSSNRLEQLPAELGLLTALTTLNLRCNLLCELPAQIGCLLALRSLDLSHNKISQLPLSMALLRSLNELDLSANRLRSVSALECVSFLGVRKMLLVDNPLEDALETVAAEKPRHALPFTVCCTAFFVSAVFSSSSFCLFFSVFWLQNVACVSPKSVPRLRITAGDGAPWEQCLRRYHRCRFQGSGARGARSNGDHDGTGQETSPGEADPIQAPDDSLRQRA